MKLTNIMIGPVCTPYSIYLSGASEGGGEPETLNPKRAAGHSSTGATYGSAPLPAQGFGLVFRLRI